MVIKCSVGKGMSEGVNYYSKDKKNKKTTELRRLIGKSNHLLSDNPKEIEQECIDIIDKADKLKKYAFRAMFSIQHKEKLDDIQWRSLVNDYCEEYGFDLQNHQYLLYLHNDTNNQHVHLIANRKPFNGDKTIDDSFYKIKSQKIIPLLVEKYGLSKNPEVVKTVSNSSFNTERERKLIFIKETCSYYLSQLKIWNHSVIGKNKINIENFKEVLKNHNIELIIRKSVEDKIVGVSFLFEGEQFSGQQAGLKAERLLKKIQKVRDKTYADTKLLNDTLREILKNFKLADDKRLLVLKDKLYKDGYNFERFKVDKLGKAESFTFKFQPFDFNDIDVDLVIDLVECETLGKIFTQKYEQNMIDDLGYLPDYQDYNERYSPDLFAGISDNNIHSAGKKFKAMDEDEEIEKERKRKKNTGLKM